MYNLIGISLDTTRKMNSLYNILLFYGRNFRNGFIFLPQTEFFSLGGSEFFTILASHEQQDNGNW
jgi:Tfp pilus assembly protein PilZ